jgi:hypothetical protein
LARRENRREVERKALELLDTREKNMRTARIVGALILISYAGVFIGAEITGAILGESDYLLNAYPDRAQVVWGVLIELVNDMAVIGIAVMLYPLLRKFSEGVALFYVGIRILEGGFFMVSKVSSLAAIDLSEKYLAGGAADGAGYESLGILNFALRDSAGVMATIAFILGGIALYYLLLRTELVPKFISIWGLLAIVSLILANAFSVPDLTQSFEPAMLLYLPIVANELFLAGWLLWKGFSSPAAGS